MKKIICILLAAIIVTICTFLTSCSTIFDGGFFDDPIEFGKQLIEKCDDEDDDEDEVWIEIEMHNEIGKDVADEFDIDEDGICARAFLGAEKYDGYAYIIYFTKSSYAKAAKKDIDVEKFSKYFGNEDDYTIKRSGKALYIGSKDILKALSQNKADNDYYSWDSKKLTEDQT